MKNIGAVNAASAYDGYKVSHKNQYPEGTQVVGLNWTPRSTKRYKGSPLYDGKIVVYGHQGAVKVLTELWDVTFFSLPLATVMSYIHRRLGNYLGAKPEDLKHFEALHKLGYLPIEIRGLDEGSLVDPKTPTFTIKNTLPEFYWVTNMLETSLSDLLWHPATVATIARDYRKILEHFTVETGASKDFIKFQAHDFSMRGLSFLLGVGAIGSGHLTQFVGTDTIPAIDYVEEYYGANSDTQLIGCSVPATEHSVMCLGGKETELETFRRLIEDVYPAGIVSIVSDTWDFFKVISEYTIELKDKILARDGKVVFRPDSGNPVDILCGLDIFDGDDQFSTAKSMANDAILNNFEYFKFNGVYYKTVLKNYDFDKAVGGIINPQFYEIQLSELEVKGAVEVLWDVFGGTTNEKGYRTLDSHVGLIYGDSITVQRCYEILSRLKAKKFATDNVVFGIGSYSYQHVTRDTFGFAMKATYGIIDGELVEVEKDPKTDDGTKKSAKGLLKVIKDGDNFKLLEGVTQKDVEAEDNELKVIFKDGEFVRTTTLSIIRQKLVGEGL